MLDKSLASLSSNVGSLIGKLVFQDLLGFSTAASAGTFTIIGVAWGVLGSLVLIAILKALNVLK